MGSTGQSKVEQRVAGFIAACREKGIKATHQRVEILRELASTEEHPDAERLYRGVRRRIPTIALDTVYRTLNVLENHGMISRVGCTRERARFDANTGKHHHFVCSDCGLVRDVYDTSFDQLPPPAEVDALGEVNTVYVELRGLCRKCRDRREKLKK